MRRAPAAQQGLQNPAGSGQHRDSVLLQMWDVVYQLAFRTVTPAERVQIPSSHPMNPKPQQTGTGLLIRNGEVATTSGFTIFQNAGRIGIPAGLISLFTVVRFRVLQLSTSVG